MLQQLQIWRSAAEAAAFKYYMTCIGLTLLAAASAFCEASQVVWVTFVMAAAHRHGGEYSQMAWLWLEPVYDSINLAVLRGIPSN
jgi:hypothetical protein